MITEREWGKWTKAALIRALKTVLQAASGTLIACATVMEINWTVVIVASLLAGGVSLCTSVFGIPEEHLE